MEYDVHDGATPAFIKEARTVLRRTSPADRHLRSLRQELRYRRQSYIGSYISLRNLVSIDNAVSDKAIEDLCYYLSLRTTFLWEMSPEDGDTFALRFYNLVIRGITGEKVATGGECVDNIIHLAESLVRSRRAFMLAMKQLLPSEYIGELFNFLETYSDTYFTPAFEDAVLGAVAIMLGSLADPLTDPSDDREPEDNV